MTLSWFRYWATDQYSSNIVVYVCALRTAPSEQIQLMSFKSVMKSTICHIGIMQVGYGTSKIDLIHISI